MPTPPTGTQTLILECQRGRKTWCALIHGQDRKYGLKRQFVASIERTNDGKGNGAVEYLLEPEGLYEFAEKGVRGWCTVEADGTVVKLSKVEALSRVTAMTAKQKALDDEVNNKIARFNQEGGFSYN